MIVKNEAPVIARCLASVKPWVDHWVIVDTGSSDGTQDLVRQCMEGVPGSLHERPWVDFAHNRNEALELARPHGDYLLFIDADEQLRVPEGFAWPALEADGCMLSCHMAGTEYQRNALIATRVDWRWEGVLHEYLTAPAHQAWQMLAGPYIDVSHDGARARDPQTYLRDIAVLERPCASSPATRATCSIWRKATATQARSSPACSGTGSAPPWAAGPRSSGLRCSRSACCWSARAPSQPPCARPISPPMPRDRSGPSPVRAGALPSRAVRVCPGLPLCAPGRRAAAPGRGHPVHRRPGLCLARTGRAGRQRLLHPLRELQQLLAERRYPASEQTRIEANRPFYGL